MGTKIGKEKIVREPGYLYFIGKDGYVWAAPMKHNKTGKKKKVGTEKIAKEKGIQGTVYVTFVVDTDGSITDVRVLRGIGGGCDEEAVRVVQLMPKWKPGYQDGKPVRVQFNMPLRFTLN